MNRILVIRGGAIGDFLLTLPAIKLLRDRYPQAWIEILGYKHIAALAEKRNYAQAVRSIEDAALARFFVRDAELPDELCRYFRSFDLILSYLFDPDAVFGGNLRRCGAVQLLTGPAKVGAHEHAAYQLARPLREIGLSLREPGAQLYLREADRLAAAHLFPAGAQPLIAIHPGSGSAEKNWPVEKWLALREAVVAHFLVIAGEADFVTLAKLRGEWSDSATTYMIDQPLPIVAALLERCHHFVGHDSGISHIAAAAGTPSTLLFGPTDPEIWAPQNAGVRIIRAASKRLDDISCAQVAATLRS